MSITYDSGVQIINGLLGSGIITERESYIKAFGSNNTFFNNGTGQIDTFPGIEKPDLEHKSPGFLRCC